MSKLELEDSFFLDMVSKMSKGNPGAITALLALYKGTAAVDPDSILGGLGMIFNLDTNKIYGTDIYILWSDKCQRDIRKMIMILRAVQLGYLSERKLQQMAGDQMGEIDLTQEKWADLDRRVCNMLPNFQRAD